MVRLTGVHHVGIPVRDLESSLAWYKDVFGVDPAFRLHFEGPELSEIVQVEGARIDAAYLEIGETMLELLHYTDPEAAPFTLRNCDVGAMHVTFEVEDIEAAHQELVDKGLSINSPPGLIPEGPLAGHRGFYFRDPDGVQYELFQRP